MNSGSLSECLQLWISCCTAKLFFIALPLNRIVINSGASDEYGILNLKKKTFSFSFFCIRNITKLNSTTWF